MNMNIFNYADVIHLGSVFSATTCAGEPASLSLPCLVLLQFEHLNSRFHLSICPSFGSIVHSLLPAIYLYVCLPVPVPAL